jgi:hypothetical protein
VSTTPVIVCAGCGARHYDRALGGEHIATCEAYARRLTQPSAETLTAEVHQCLDKAGVPRGGIDDQQGWDVRIGWLAANAAHLLGQIERTMQELYEGPHILGIETATNRALEILSAALRGEPAPVYGGDDGTHG